MAATEPTVPPRWRPEVVDDQESTFGPSTTEKAATSILLLSLKALSQRAAAAVADLFTLLTVFSAWWLWYSIPEPNQNQIVALTIYAAFVLLANWLVRKK